MQQARQDETRQEKTRQGRQNKARQDKTRQSNLVKFGKLPEFDPPLVSHKTQAKKGA